MARKIVQMRGLPDGCFFRGGQVICTIDALRGLVSSPKQKRIKPRRARRRRRGK